MQTCSLPIETASELIRLGHGSGGKLTAQLIERVFLPRIGNSILNELDDAACIEFGNARLAVSTDSYVVNPLFFPGGDIGSLSVHGTINDLAMRLAKPLFMSVSFIIEEGFSISELERIVDSFSAAAKAIEVQVVAADTKVVNRDAGDGVFINTTGFGIITCANPPSARRAKPGDSIIVNGDLACHGMAILCAREGLELESELVSDSAPLHEIAMKLSDLNVEIHSMRDLTRGGISSALNEIAQAAGVGIEIDENMTPINSTARAACEILGLDPLYVACEGRFVCIVPSSEVGTVLETIRSTEQGKNAVAIGRVTDEHPGIVVTKTAIGGRRIVDKLSGDQLPRIC